jgi:hypothetical protein
MTEPKTGLASLELKDAVRLRWTLHDIKSRRTEIVPVSPDDLRILIDMGLVEMRGDVPVVTPAGDVDISHGKMFCKWLRDVHGIDTDALPTYLHVFEDGRRVWPKAYPEELLAAFRRHFREEWLPNRAIEYFRGRNSEALQFLPKLIAANKPQRLN